MGSYGGTAPKKKTSERYQPKKKKPDGTTSIKTIKGERKEEPWCQERRLTTHKPTNGNEKNKKGNE